MPPLVLLPLLLVLLSCSSPSVLGGGADEHEYTLVALKSLKPKATCSGHRVTPPQNITWVPLNLPHGPCSPLSDAASTAPSLAELLLHDQIRVDDIQMRLSGNPDAGDAKKRSAGGRTYQKFGNLLAVNFGGGRRRTSSSMQVSQLSATVNASAAGSSSRSSLPGVVQTVVLDSASDVPWVQCVPCPIPPCHPQVDSFYDPSRSPTSAPFSCSSPTCTGLGPYANRCVNGQCQYRVLYPDGSSTSGSYIADLLTFDASTAVGGFKFGCSHAEQGSFDTRAAGIMALGGGPESLLSQTASTYGNAFAYCTPATSSDSGFFTLGVPSRAASRYVVTPMVRFPQ